MRLNVLMGTTMSDSDSESVLELSGEIAMVSSAAVKVGLPHLL